MGRNRFKPLVWPVALLVVGALASALAETAAGRWQDYQLYGMARPVADVLLVIGIVWLVLAAVSMVRRSRG